MNKLLVSALVFFICNLLLYTDNGILVEKKVTYAFPSQTASNYNKNLYINNKNKFSIVLPDGWKITAENNGDFKVIADDGNAATMNILILPLPEEIKNFTIANLTVEEIEFVVRGNVDNAAQMNSNLKFLGSGTTYINNKKAIWIKTSQLADSIPTTSILTLIWHNGNQYFITYGAKSYAYDAYYRLFEASIKSFAVDY